MLFFRFFGARLVAAFLASFGLAHFATAAPVMPSVSDSGWVTDRYEPASWSVVPTFQGRDSVRQIGIDSTTNAANRPSGLQSAFYNTQGRQIGVTGGTGDSLRASLWLDQSWADPRNGFVRTDLWGRAGGTEAETTYTIAGFTNFGGAARFRVFDANVSGGWVNLGLDLTNLFGSWVDFEILSLSDRYEYFINGTSVYTDSTIGAAGTGFTRAFLQAFNFNESSVGVTGNPGYFARWSDTPDGTVPVPGTLALAGLALPALVFITRRRRPQVTST